MGQEAEDDIEEAEIPEHVPGVESCGGGEHVAEFLGDAFGADAGELVGVGSDGVGGCGFDLECEPGGKADGAKEAEVILLEASVWVADGADASSGEVLYAADVVDDLFLLDVVEETVDRKIAASGVLFRRAEHVVLDDQQVVLGAADQQRARGDQGQELVLVDRQLVDAVVERLVVAAEPVREGGVDAPDGLAEPPPRQRRAALAGVVGDDEGEPLVLRPRPERRLAQPRVTHDCHVFRTDVDVALEVIKGATQAPGPGGNRTPLIGRWLCPRETAEQEMDAVLKSVVEIGIDVAIVDGREPVAAAARGPPCHEPRGYTEDPAFSRGCDICI